MKRLLINIIIISFCIMPTFSASFIIDDHSTKYMQDDGTFIVAQWRWIDTDLDGIAYCYRFDDNGEMLRDTTYNGKTVNQKGEWVVNNIPQRLMLSTGKLYNPASATDNAALGALLSENQQIATAINATKNKSISKVTEEITNSNQVAIKNDKNIRDEQGRIISAKVDKAPKATASVGVTINAAGSTTAGTSDDGTRVIPGRNIKNLVSSSTNFVNEVDATVYGGYKWPKAMCLKGSGSKVRFSINGYNYFRVEVAHQTHTAATEDTFCYIEVYADGVQIGVYEAFNDDEPELIEEYLDDNTKIVELRLTVEGSAKGRKVYLRDGRIRKIKS